MDPARASSDTLDVFTLEIDRLTWTKVSPRDARQRIWKLKQFFVLQFLSYCSAIVMDGCALVGDSSIEIFTLPFVIETIGPPPNEPTPEPFEFSE